MSDEASFREVEPTPVQLTRMEGVLNLILFRMDDVVTRVIHLEGKVTQHDSDISTIKAEAAARLVTANTVAETLKDKSTEDLASSNRKWTPLTRVVGIASLVLYLTTIYFMFKK